MAAGPTNVGRIHMLDVCFHGTTQVDPWYVGLINNTPTPSFAATDTMSSHAGWSALEDASHLYYSQTTRPPWVEGAATGTGSMTNSAGTTVDFSIVAASQQSVYGIFLTSDNTKGGTSGTLFATAAFSGGVQTVNNGDTLKVTITITLA